MKTFLFFLLISSFCAAQHPDLLNNDWKIVKIEGEMHPVMTPPPMSHQQVTNFSTQNPQMVVSFFNVVSADLVFDTVENKFTVINKSCTLADYDGDNGEVNQFFDMLCSFFQLNDSFYYHIGHNGAEKTLQIGSSTFQDIYFVSSNLDAKERKLSQYLLSPNPVIKNLTIENTSGINAVSLYDTSGKLLYELKNENSKVLNIDMQNYKTGIYYIKLNNERSYKIIKK